MAGVTTRNTKNRAIRQEALREQLAAGGHLQHVLDIAEKLSNEINDLDSLMVQRLKAAADIKCKLISKYLPDLKAMEISGELNGTQEHTHSLDAKSLSTQTLKELLEARAGTVTKP
jgi:hypothetical protein